MEYLTVEDLLVVVEETVGRAAVRDLGLLDSAAHRPRAGAFGEDAYPTLHDKAAALLEGIVRNRALVDGKQAPGDGVGGGPGAESFEPVEGGEQVGLGVAVAQRQRQLVGAAELPPRLGAVHTGDLQGVGPGAAAGGSASSPARHSQ